MNIDQFRQNVFTMLDAALDKEIIIGMVDKAILSGCIDVDNVPAGDYTIPKALAHVIITNLANTIKPFSEEGRAEVKNISCFI